MRPASAWLAAAVTLLVATCTDGVEEVPSPEHSGKERCEVEFEPSSEFELKSTIRRSAPDHIGIRESYVGPGGRVIHLFSGIAGEFGEGLPVAGTLPVAGGYEARLLGREPDWVLYWETTGACAPKAVVGNGFSRNAFMIVLEASGILSAA